jgi:activator of 2-hydroxyglutaryl-CoA dehydratase
MTGGVAQNAGVVQALQDKLGETILVPGEAQLCGALGAALFALK